MLHSPALPLLRTLLLATAAVACDTAPAPQANLTPEDAAHAAPAVPRLPLHVATTPAPRTDPGWVERAALLDERAATGTPRVLFVGDSITQGWEGAGRDVWSRAYGDRDAVNLGIGGDRTQHVLWRLQNGNLPEGIAPELCVVMIGTNNSNSDTSEEIADGVTAVVRELWHRLPETRILVLEIFPRGADATDDKRAINEGANARIARLAEYFPETHPERHGKSRVRVLDIGDAFLEPDGRLPQEIMPDLLHLSPEGYARWARAIEAEVADALGEEPREL